MNPIELEQRNLCKIHNVEFYPSLHDQRLGISDNAQSGELPINGLRHLPVYGTCGWYIWAGTEMSHATDFFKPIHVFHLYDTFPDVLRFLGLPPGWRFLLAPDHEDVWHDLSLLVE